MAKVLGVGGVFFKSRDPEGLGSWYQKWLGIEIEPAFGGTCFFPEKLPQGAYTVWAPFSADTTYFDPASNPYMINFIVDDLREALRQVQQGGAKLEGEPEGSELGSFGWFIDPDGNKVELWQPKPASTD